MNVNQKGDTMSGSRREFLMSSCAALLAPEVTSAAQAAPTPAAASPAEPAPGSAAAAPGTAAAVGPEVSAATFAEAEKLAMVDLTAAERVQAAQNWRSNMATRHERRSGPRKVALAPTLAPYSICSPVLPGHGPLPQGSRFVRSDRDAGALPAADADIAYAPLWKLSRWIESRHLSSERLTRIYLERIARFDPQLRCVITPTRDLALEQARRTDREIAAGNYRGPRAGHRRSRGAPPACGRCGARCQVEPRRPCAQRRVVRRTDHESLAAGGGFFRLERRARCGDGGGSGGLLD